MLRVTTLLIVLTATFIEGCSKAPPPLPVIRPCVVPYTEEPVIDNTPCPDANESTRIKCVHDKALKNYEAQKAYGQKLKTNSEVCQ